MNQLLSTVLFLAAASIIQAQQTAPPATPEAAVEELLQVDRDFATKSAETTVTAGLSPMLADDVIMPQPGGIFAEGKDAVVEALRKNPVNEKASVTWTPVRGGISADGQQGFTFGYMTMRVPDSADVPMKYLSYWVRTPQGWRVAALKRARRPAGEVSLAMMPPALPPRLVTPSADQATIETFRKSVGDAERAFSAEAEIIGLPAAFRKHGSADAVNMAGPASPSFVVGAEAIGKSMEDGSPPSPSPVSWGADRVIAASSGDLGVTFGVIRTNAPDAEGKHGAYAFFTVWRRASPADRWLYVAE
jgi:ketosteroid isomerase-like protein